MTKSTHAARAKRTHAERITAQKPDFRADIAQPIGDAFIARIREYTETEQGFKIDESKEKTGWGDDAFNPDNITYRLEPFITAAMVDRHATYAYPTGQEDQLIRALKSIILEEFKGLKSSHKFKTWPAVTNDIDKLTDAFIETIPAQVGALFDRVKSGRSGGKGGGS